MTATAAQILQVRRMVAEPTATTYTDLIIQGTIETYPAIDENGCPPYYWSTSIPPTKIVNTAWVATYDLNAAAGAIWQEKAAALAGNYDFSTDGQSFQRSQAYNNAIGQARYYQSRRKVGTTRLVPDYESNYDRYTQYRNS